MAAPTAPNNSLMQIVVHLARHVHHTPKALVTTTDKTRVGQTPGSKGHVQSVPAQRPWRLPPPKPRSTMTVAYACPSS
jgi:hypothetical protein